MPTEISPVRVAERTHLYWLDWLRFLAAFVVLIDHTRAFNWDGLVAYSGNEHSPALALLVALGTLGRQAVVVFFVLSGWLVGGNTVARMRAGTFDTASYAADRISRVYVPLVPALLFTMAIVRSLDATPKPMQYLVCLVGLQDVIGIHKPEANAALWTLGYEIWFYVLAGGASVACRRSSAGWARLLGIVGAVLAVWICIELGVTYLLCWLIGAAGGWLRGRLAPAVRPWTAAAGLLVMAAGAVIYQIDMGILPPPSDDIVLPQNGVAQLIVAAGALLLAASLSAMAPRARAGRWIERAGGWVAAFSYTLYLIHYPVLGCLRACLEPMPATQADARAFLRGFSWAALCVVAALIMHALFERQTPRVRRWLRAKFAGAATEATPAVTGGERLAPAR